MFRELTRIHSLIAYLGYTLITSTAYAISFIIRLDPVILDTDISFVPITLMVQTFPILVVLRLGGFLGFGLHRRVWRYFRISDVVDVVKGVTASSVIFVIVVGLAFSFDGYPRSVFVIDWALNIILLTAVPLVVRIVRERINVGPRSVTQYKRMLIVGAGHAGVALCAQTIDTKDSVFKPVAFVDDDESKIGTVISGVPVVGNSSKMALAVSELRVDLIVLAIPSATSTQIRKLIELCRGSGVEYKIMPATVDILDGSVSMSRVRDVDPTDLLGRPAAKLNQNLIRDYIKGKRILVTGAAGSVGSELTKQIASLRPELLILIDIAENPLFFLETDLGNEFAELSAIVQLMDITDADPLTRLMQKYRPDVIYHAAAHKHVHLMERTPSRAVKNNIGGTVTLARCAIAAGVQKFISVSTDKAVNPTSVMGVTKRITELIIQQLNGSTETKFTSVRFGNVIGSQGSVVPIFQRQIESYGPITVTSPEATRYFMSIHEASALILQAGAVGIGGEVFVLDMGEPVKIVDLARNMISLSNNTSGTDVEIVFTGLRPGEKLHEELTSDCETLVPTKHDKLFIVQTGGGSPTILTHVDELLAKLPELEPDQVIHQLKQLVPEYDSAPSSIV